MAKNDKPSTGLSSEIFSQDQPPSDSSRQPPAAEDAQPKGEPRRVKAVFVNNGQETVGMVGGVYDTRFDNRGVSVAPVSQSTLERLRSDFPQVQFVEI